MRRHVPCLVVLLIAAACGRSEPAAVDAAGSPAHGSEGSAETTALYWGLESRGERIEPLRAIDGPAPSAWHYAVRSDREGQPTGWSFVSPSGVTHDRAVVERGGPTARKLTLFDAYGVLTYESTQTSSGDTAVRWRSGVTTFEGCSTRKKRFDERGRVTRITCVDPDGGVVINKRGCAIEHLAWSWAGDLTRRSCHDEEDQPSLDRWGVHATGWQHDERGWQISARTTDVAGAAVLHARDGCAHKRIARDAAGNAVGETCLGDDGEPVLFAGRTYSGTRSTFDRSGCEVRRRYVNVGGLRHADGRIAELRWRRDGSCGELGYRQLDGGGQLAGNDEFNPWGYEQQLSGEGLVTRKTCRGEGGRPVTCLFAEPPDSCECGATYTFEYDDRGRQVCRRGWATGEVPARLSYSYPHATCTEYGRDGRRANQQFHNGDGLPEQALGVYRMNYEHDVLGYQVREYYTDADGEPMRSAVACAGFRDHYDERQRYLGRSCRDVDDSLTGSVGGLHQAGVSWPDGTARVAVRRDERHRVTANDFIDVDGSIIETRSCVDPTSNCYRW